MHPIPLNTSSVFDRHERRVLTLDDLFVDPMAAPDTLAAYAHGVAAGSAGTGVPIASTERRSRPYSFLTAWPPNSLRIEASSLSANESLSRERRRSISAAVMMGAGTSSSSAAATVQRPSPESTT